MLQSSRKYTGIVAHVMVSKHILSRLKLGQSYGKMDVNSNDDIKCDFISYSFSTWSNGAPFTDIVLRLAWWLHQMECFSALPALCARNSLVPGEFLSQRPVTRSFDVFFDIRLNKHSRRPWFEIPSHSLWRHCNVHPCPIFNSGLTKPPLWLAHERVIYGYNDASMP